METLTLEDDGSDNLILMSDGGSMGPPGKGVPPAGSTGQVLTKSSDTDPQRP